MAGAGKRFFHTMLALKVLGRSCKQMEKPLGSIGNAAHFHCLAMDFQMYDIAVYQVFHLYYSCLHIRSQNGSNVYFK